MEGSGQARIAVDDTHPGESIGRRFSAAPFSSRFSHSSKCGHSDRIVSRPISNAARTPISGFWYPGTSFVIRFDGAVCGESSISSGKASRMA